MRTAASDRAGTAIVGGIDVARDPEAVKQRIGYMSQRFSLYELLTVDQNISFFGGIYGLSPAKLAERRAFVIEMAGLAGRETTLARDLSGGWRQRLALGCAILHEPPILFLDEPTGGVDPLSRRQFWRLIDTLSTSGVTVLVTTHYLDEAERCHRVALIHAGRLATIGTVGEVKGIFASRPIVEIRADRPVDAMKLLDAMDGCGEDQSVRHRTCMPFCARSRRVPEDDRSTAARGRLVGREHRARRSRRSRMSFSTSWTRPAGRRREDVSRRRAARSFGRSAATGARC